MRLVIRNGLVKIGFRPPPPRRRVFNVTISANWLLKTETPKCAKSALLCKTSQFDASSRIKLFLWTFFGGGGGGSFFFFFKKIQTSVGPSGKPSGAPTHEDGPQTIRDSDPPHFAVRIVPRPAHLGHTRTKGGWLQCGGTLASHSPQSLKKMISQLSKRSFANNKKKKQTRIHQKQSEVLSRHCFG